MAENTVENEVVVKATVSFDGTTYFVEDETHGKQECTVLDSGWLTIPENDANRKYLAMGKVNKFFEENPDGVIEMTYKATRKLDGTSSSGPRTPNARLISYLSEEDQAEYNAIIERAKAAWATYKEEHKRQPKTEAEKLQAKIAKLQAQFDALLADAKE